MSNIGPTSTIGRIRALEEEGKAIGSEYVPEPYYWNWPIKDASLIPDDLRQCIYGDELRWYGED